MNFKKKLKNGNQFKVIIINNSNYCNKLAFGFY